MPYANANNISIYYEVHGDNGSPLLMIHGLGASKAGWPPPFIDLLSKHHRMIIFDNRGVGQSDKPISSYTMADFASDAVTVLDDLNIARAHVFGVSLGGAIAQHLALNHSTRVLSLILACTTSVWTSSPHFVAPSQDVLTQLTRPSSGDRARDTRENWNIFHPPAFIASNRYWLEKRLAESLSITYPETSDHARRLQFEANSTHDVYGRLPQIVCPTLVQTGAEDVLVPPENSRILADRIPNTQLKEYSGYGHGFFDANAENVVQDMLAFISGND